MSRIVNKGVVVLMDSSSIARRSEKFGIIVTAATLLRFQQMALPCIHSRSPIAVHASMSSIIAVFENTIDAMVCAATIHHQINLHNSQITDVNTTFSIFTRICIEGNQTVAIAKTGEIYVENIKNLYKMRKAMSNRGGIAIGDSIRDGLGSNVRIVFGSERENVHILREDAQVMLKRMISNWNPPPTARDDDATYLSPNLIPFTRLCRRARMDLAITALSTKFERSATALVYAISCISRRPRRQAEAAAIAADLVRKVIRLSGGWMLGRARLVLFPNEADAVSAALSIARMVRKYNQLADSSDIHLICRGIGIDQSNIIEVQWGGMGGYDQDRERDVLFGRCIIRATNIADNTATGGSILCTSAVHSEISRNRSLGTLKFTKCENDFSLFKVLPSQ